MCEFCGAGPDCVVCGRGLDSMDDPKRQERLDEFAKAAMQGILSSCGECLGIGLVVEKVAKDSYMMARAMMQERQAHVNKPKVRTEIEAFGQTFKS